MNKRTSMTANRLTLMIGASLLALAAACNTSQAYPDYSGCATCHGDFNGSTSPRGTIFPSGSNHEMHRASSSMGTDCNLCHVTPGQTPVYTGYSGGTSHNDGLGCSGCHVGPGLREHHKAHSVNCYLGGCHTFQAPPPESVSPPYYGTVDTKVKNPGNTVRAANTNENWSVGDFLGLDNDGNNLYDAADFAITPYRILSTAKEGNNVRVTWQTVGGRKDAMQASGVVNGSYSNVSSTLTIPGAGVVTTNYVDVGALTSKAKRFYRVTSVP